MGVIKSCRIYLPGLLLALITAAFGCGFMSEAASSSSIQGTYRYDLAWDVLDGLNSARKENGVSTLKRDQYLTDIAMLRASELSVSYSHTRPDGTSCFTAGNTAYFKCENMARGYATAEAMSRAWLNSSSHYETLMSPSYTGIGIGCFESVDGTIYWIECLGVYQSSAVKQSNYSVGVSAKGKTVSITGIENMAGGIKLKWKKISGVSGYYVYRKASGDSAYTKIKTIKKDDTVSYKDTEVKGTTGTKYRYKVVPYTKSDGAKGTGVAKTIVRVDRPTLKSVKSQASRSISLTWKTVPKATGYKINFSRSQSFSSSYYYMIPGASSKSYTIRKLSPGTYYVRLCAYKTKGGVDYTSAYSSTAKVTVS